MDKHRIAIGSHITIQLDLVPEPREEFMRSVDANLSGLHGIADSKVVQTLGTCGKPLAQVLQLLAGIMDNLADVSRQ